MPHLAPQTLARSEQEALLRASATHPRDHLTFSVALGTGLRLAPKLERFWRYKRQAGESLDPDAPLFANQSGDRISKRRVQVVFRGWQERSGFDRLYPLHALRHTAVTNVYRSSRDLFLAQRFARHVSPLTTVCYTHPSDEELRAGVRELVCWGIPLSSFSETPEGDSGLDCMEAAAFPLSSPRRHRPMVPHSLL